MAYISLHSLIICHTWHALVCFFVFFIILDVFSVGYYCRIKFFVSIVILLTHTIPRTDSVSANKKNVTLFICTSSIIDKAKVIREENFK